MKKLIFIILFLLILSPLRATAEEIALPKEEAEMLYGALSDDAQQAMDDTGAGVFSNDWNENFTYENIFKTIISFLRSGGKEPFICCVALLAVSVITAGIAGVSGELESEGVLNYAMLLAACLLLLLPVLKLAASVDGAIKGLATFMLAFVPVYGGILLSNGMTVTASGFSGIMLVAAQVISQLCSFVILPIISMHLSLSVATTSSPVLGRSTLAETFKKIANWILSLAMTVFLAVFGAHTAIGSSVDSVSSKAVRFVAGTTIPLVGTAVSEAAGTVKSCMSMIGTSAGMYGIIALILTALPVILQLTLWRLCVQLSGMVCSLLGQRKIEGMLKAVDTSLSFMIGIIICIGMLFIISLAMVTAAGGRV